MTEQLQLLSVDSLEAAEWNRDVGDIEDLAASIKDIGLIEPIVARPRNGGFELVAGERRWRAAMKAGLTEIPTIVKELDDRQALEVQLIENLQRKDIEPLEEAHGYKLLVGFGVKQKEIATKVRRSQAHVSKRLALLDLPEVAREALSAGKLSVETALELKPLNGIRDEVARDVIDDLSRGHGNPKWLIQRAVQQDAFETKAAAAREKLEASGVEIIEPPDNYGAGKTRVLGKDWYGIDVKVAAHRKEPCHAGFVDRHGAIAWACTDPSRHLAKGASSLKMSADSAKRLAGRSSSPAKSQKQKDEEKAFREATKTRHALLREILGGSISEKTAFSLAARYAMQRMLHDEARMVCTLLELDVPETKTNWGAKQRDYSGAVRELGEQGPTQLRRVLAAIAFAQSEDSLNFGGDYGWRRAQPWFEFLGQYGYEPSVLEKKYLAKKGR